MDEERLDDIREGARYIVEGHDTEPDVVRLAQDLADVVDEALRLRGLLREVAMTFDGVDPVGPPLRDAIRAALAATDEHAS